MKNFFILLAFFVSQNTFAGFNDIQNNPWSESIKYLKSESIVKGYPNGNFDPEQKINRAEFTKIVIKSLYEDFEWKDQSKNCFNDLEPDAWYTPYICLAKEEGIINGYDDGSFKPAQNVNQAEALKILHEAFYEDIEPTSGEWFQKYLDAAEYDGMFYFEPENPGAYLINRSQMAYFTAWMLDEDETLDDQIKEEKFYGKAYENEDFGWEAENEADCFPDEYFDAKESLCYLAEAEFNHENEKAYYDEEDFENLKFSDHEKIFDANSDFIYSVNGNKMTLVSGDKDPLLELPNQEKHQIVWERFTELIPEKSRSQVSEFLVFEDPADDTLAFVSEVDSSLEKWQLGVNLANTFGSEGDIFDHKEFDLTLIHEFAHIMTLNQKQIDPTKTEDACRPEFFTAEGCAKKTAFINLFFKKFWVKKSSDESRFVTDYAQTSPGEDIAETFAYFVVNPKPKDCQNSVAESKICFFYKYPSLLTLRKRIREKLR